MSRFASLSTARGRIRVGFRPFSPQRKHAPSGHSIGLTAWGAFAKTFVTHSPGSPLTLLMDDQLVMDRAFNSPAFCHQEEFANVLFYDGSAKGHPNLGKRFTHSGGDDAQRTFREADKTY